MHVWRNTPGCYLQTQVVMRPACTIGSVAQDALTNGNSLTGTSTTMMAMMRSGTLGAISSRRGVVRMFGGMAAAAAVTGRGDPAATRRKHHRKMPAETNGTTVTQIFSNTAPIAINTYGSATPFPSRIQVSGFEKAIITDVDLVLNGLSHLYTVEVDIMLVAPDGRNALILSDAGKGGANGLDIRLDDEAGTDLPEDPLVSGTYRPTNISDANDPGGVDIFDATFAPMPSGKVALSTFDGGDPNGEWQLFVRDDRSGDGGNLSGGWGLRITAMTAAKKKRRKKHKKKR